MTEADTRGRVTLVRETLVLTGLATIITCVLVGLLADPRLALTIALGAGIAGANFLLLARGIARAIDRASEDPGDRSHDPDHPHEPIPAAENPSQPPAAENGLRSGLRLALLLLAMLGILWYMPARPEGLAVGVLIVLLAATIAGFRHNRAI